MAVWHRIDPSRTALPLGDDPSEAWARYALGANVLCVRGDDGRPSTVSKCFTFRDWIRTGRPRPPTVSDLDYHLTTLFPPIRPRGYLELRMIDAQPDDQWAVPLGVCAALTQDAQAFELAVAAAEPLLRHPLSWSKTDHWLRAAKYGLSDPLIGEAAKTCFRAAYDALPRIGVSGRARERLADFICRYVERNRCPADDALDRSRNPSGWRGKHLPTRWAE
jgi:glutamate--cysteine ligase